VIVKKIFSPAIAALTAALLVGCGTSGYHGKYVSLDGGWRVTIDRDGYFQCLVNNPDGNLPTATPSGYCNFDVSDPHRPELVMHQKFMEGKMRFVFSPDGSQLAVILQRKTTGKTTFLSAIGPEDGMAGEQDRPSQVLLYKRK